MNNLKGMAIIKNYDVFMLIVLILSFMRFVGIINISFFVILSIIGILCILNKKSVIYLVSLGIASITSFSGKFDFIELTKIYSIVFTSFILMDFFLNREIKTLGRLSRPLIFLLVITMLSFFVTENYLFSIYSFLIVLTYLIAYIYLFNVLTEEDKLISIKMITYISIFITFEICYILISNPEAFGLLTGDRASFPMGWENLNVVVFANLVAIPLIMYMLHFKQNLKFYVPSLIIVSFGAVITLSRSTILSVAIYFFLYFAYMLFRKFDFKKMVIYCTIVVGSILVILFTLELSNIITIPERFTSGLFFVGDRMVLYEIAWKEFTKSPILGTGGLYTSRYYLSHIGWFNYHNTVLQFLTLGISGIIAFIYLFTEKFIIIKNSNSNMNWFVLIMLVVTAFVNGFFQPMYFSGHYMIYMFILIVLVEKTDLESNHL